MSAPPFQKILIANRGEIAVRVIRACRELGIASVAVYSDADQHALHALQANEAYPLHGNESRDTYLNQQKILEIARRSGAQALHPGYGFLSENAGFAQACADAGIVFIGPPPSAIASMGSKARARQLMIEAGVPVSPGSRGVVASADEVKLLARTIGYPLLLKAVSGGGGRGMRVAMTPAEVDTAFTTATSEAQSAFGDGSLYVERFLGNPKHIEVQVLADRQGHCIHLLERECSIQRKNQKLIEECPSAAISPDIRAKLGAIAVKAAKACGYVGAGTIEFLFEPPDTYFFIEMNTRIQVEHPVTEMVTGIDLVQWQIRIAAGERLNLRQEDIRTRGYAIECRINAEDTEGDFRPSPGRITRLVLPSGPGVRVDFGVTEGFEVPRYYDSMLGKLITWGETRDVAVQRMVRALDEMRVLGVPTTNRLLRTLLGTKTFVEAHHTVPFLRRFIEQNGVPLPDRQRSALAAAVAVALFGEAACGTTTHVQPTAGRSSGWQSQARLVGFKNRRR